MPSAGRSFYTDQPNGQKYFTYITEELPRYLREVFGLAPLPGGYLDRWCLDGRIWGFQSCLTAP